MVEVYKCQCKCGFISKKLHLGKRDDEPFYPFIKLGGYFNDESLKEIIQNLNDLNDYYNYLSVSDDFKIKHKKEKNINLSKLEFEKRFKEFLEIHFSKIHNQYFDECMKLVLNEPNENERYHEFIITGENQKFSINKWLEILNLDDEKYCKSLLDVIVDRFKHFQSTYHLFLYRSHEKDILSGLKYKPDLIDIVSVKNFKPIDVRYQYSEVLSLYDYYDRPVLSNSSDDWTHYENNRIYEEPNEFDLMTVIKCCYNCCDIDVGGVYLPFTHKSYNNTNCIKCDSKNTRVFGKFKNSDFNNYFSDSLEPPEQEEIDDFETQFSKKNFLFKWDFKNYYYDVVYYMENKKYNCPKCHQDNLFFEKISTLWD